MSYDGGYNEEFEPKGNVNIYSTIDNTEIYGGGDFIDSYSYSYGEDSNSSQLYTKADTAKTGLNKDGSSEPWNVSKSEAGTRWRDKITQNGVPVTDGPEPFEPNFYPYSEYHGTTGSDDDNIRIKPGHNVIRRTTGFSLFSILINNQSYTFSTKNEKYTNSPYDGFNDSSSTSKTDPDIQTIKNNYLGLISSQRELVDYLKYGEDTIEEINVPDRLNERIKAGDVIYFYTQKNSQSIEYMTVITPQLERCTYQELIDAAVMKNPFTFQYIDSITNGGEDYVYTINNATSVFYKDNDNVAQKKYVAQYGSDLANLIGYISDSAFNIGIISSPSSTDANELVHFQSGTKSEQAYEFSVFRNNETENDTLTIGSHNHNPEHQTDAVKMPLKISNMQIRENNIGNMETVKCFRPDDFILDYSGFCYSLEESDFDYGSRSFTVPAAQLLSDTTIDYRCGAICITYDSQADKHVFSRVAKYIFSPEDEKTFTIAEDFGDTTVHDILIWVEPLNGLRHYSHHTIAKYEADIDSYTIVPLNESYERDEEDKSTVVDPTVFEVSGISVDEMTDGQIDIYVPETATDLSVYINSQRLTVDDLFANSWCTIQITDTVGTVINDVTDKEHNGMRRYRLSVSVKDNIPQLGDSDITTARQFIASPGTQNSPLDGCTLFNSLMKGTNVATKSRNVTVSAIYLYEGKEVKSYHKVVQPGYAETRKVPKVALNLRSDLNTLELSNKTENGVLCNQFQFFMDVIITDFERSNWGSYVNEDDVTLNMDIVSAEYDYDFIKKYQIQAAIPTTNVHINTPGDTDDFDDNYCMIRTFLVGTDVSDETATSQILLDESHVNLMNKMSGSEVQDNVRLSSGDTDNDFANTDDRYFNGLSAGAAFTEPDVRNTGLTDAINISLRNIKFSYIRSGKLRVRVLMEFGNPLFARLFFKFYVRDMWVSYNDSEIGEVKFYVGRSNLMKKDLQSSSYTETNFMYASEPFRAFVCPVTMTAIDRDIEQQLGFEHNMMQDGSMLSGTDNQDDIILRLAQYTSRVEILSDRKRTERYAMEQSVGWFDYVLKKKWFQDNVKSISVQPLSPLSLKSTLSSHDSFVNAFDSRDAAFDEIDSNGNGVTDYLSVIYNMNIFPNRKKEKDKTTFRLDYEDYEGERYNQWNLLAPAFVAQDMSLEVRDDKLFNSVYVWNGIYEQSGKQQNGIFRGHLSPYGNGYMFLDAGKTYGDFESDLTYDLEDTMMLNDETLLTDMTTTVEDGETRNFYIPGYDLYMSAAEPATPTEYMPENGAWHRSILYQLRWQYPKHYTDNRTQNDYIDTYNIVPAGKFFYDTRLESRKTTHDKEIPYNLTYSIYPRCAYDYETDNTIIFMLRCPSIIEENHYEMGAGDVYCSTVSPSDYK